VFFYEELDLLLPFIHRLQKVQQTLQLERVACKDTTANHLCFIKVNSSSKKKRSRDSFEENDEDSSEINPDQSVEDSVSDSVLLDEIEAIENESE